MFLAMGMIALCIAAWLGGVYVAYALVAINPRDDH
jgi:hypothetical protein